MSRIFITGDTHADVRRFSTTNFPIGDELTKEDYVIILGDFGLVWNQEKESKVETYWLNWLEEKPWTTLFISGNHENYDRLNDFSAYPKEEWNGGMVQKIRPSVIHLCFGEIFNLGGFSFLALGGAASHDIDDGVLEIDDIRIKAWSKDKTKLFRINHLSWWADEVPGGELRQNAVDNLNKVNHKVDYVLCHEAPSSDVVLLSNRYYQPDEFSIWIEENVRQAVDYNTLYFGHYHINKRITDKEICLYEDIVEIHTYA